MSVKKIVLTGGPCSGKTSAIEHIKKYFTDQGYMVFIVNEVPTELINNGIAPFGDNQIRNDLFGKFVFNHQFIKEAIYEEYINQIETAKPKIIIYDRGGMDYKAYLDEKVADQIRSEANMDEEDIKSRYDMVIYLQSVANGLAECYTLENNNARSESVEQAKIVDIKNLEVWKGHPNLKIVGIFNTFEEKADAVIKHIELELTRNQLSRVRSIC